MILDLIQIGLLFLILLKLCQITTWIKYFVDTPRPSSPVRRAA